MNIAVVGLSHKTAPVEVREKLSIQEAKIEEALTHLKGYPHIEEVAVISTCNRLEIYAVVTDTEKGVVEITQFLSEIGHIPLSYLRRYLFTLLHQDAVRHLLRVAAGLESLVLGEGQILAQVKTTHKLSQKYKGIGRLLDRLFKQAITAGKRVRSETNIGTGAVSISSAAVELAITKVDDLATRNISIIGAGKMACLLVKHLVAKGATSITIVNRSQRRAEELAKKFPQAELTLVSLDEMMSVVGKSHLVFTSTGATEPILHQDNLREVVSAEQGLMLFDISVPRNVATNVQDLEIVEAYNVDDLKAVVAQNHASRRQMALEAEGLLEEEVEAFELWWRSLETVPTISCLRTKVESIREQELEKALSRLGTEFAEKHQEVIEALTRGIVNKILHEPMVQLRAQQDIEARQRCLQSLQMLFDLEIEIEKQFS
ncbi:transfer RNA-Gln reductase [Crocosphaera subtropica ATCC 51142]|uniref:Glutamyl-tRNA reductase n=1 Tax=Crocosphaera subtropica (strain ATCC 51142 / BH68) TaxID=43989 RepID=HEM1_CROS5|nr:glutamyl-tRNA reductase [Crocosphaera subtropica]B1WQ09.1 RecName: Full=Glutamyl-tRNA reductase; Short=GluTR [Crocosphaera subtropica ATCC 51142]ACB53324.1 transfer RNA-Gln reductase [Crocosphaera subtropica ATCC 51142]